MLDNTLDFDSYAAIMRRIYRVVLNTYDEEDAAREILVDWQRDTRGAGEISRRLFLDAFFEVASPDVTLPYHTVPRLQPPPPPTSNGRPRLPLATPGVV